MQFNHLLEEDYAKLTSYVFQSASASASTSTSAHTSNNTKLDGNPEPSQLTITTSSGATHNYQNNCHHNNTTNPTNNTTQMSSYREIEKQSLSTCTIQTDQSLCVKCDESSKQWIEKPVTSSSQEEESGGFKQVPITNLTPNTTIRIAPMKRNCGGWADEHFHDLLKIPTSASTSKGIIVKLQAKARECITIALSPKPTFTNGKTYAIHIGAASNLQTVIRRRLANQTEAVDITIPSPQICSDTSYKSFWIVLQSNGQLSVGIGSTPGLNCIGTLDDSMYHALRSGIDAVRYVGLGNSALGRKARDLKVRNVQVMSIPDCFPNCEIPLKPYNPVEALKHHFSNHGNAGDDDNNNANSGDNDNDPYEMLKKDAELWAEYQKECEKAQRRAKKFNIEYRQPAPDAFFRYSEARRLRANPEKGFITGIDIMSNTEKEKAGKRKQRFEAEEKKNRVLGIIGGDGDEKDNDEDMDEDGNGNDTKKQREPLPIEQAWDNIELVQELRTDPPKHLHVADNTMEDSETSINTDEKMIDDDPDADTTHIPEKIHIFAIDWAAFKQIRTDDIMGYFSMYGPSYVEWLGELSCNVLFGDKYSAARAMEGMSRALPLNPPVSLLENNEHDEDEAMGENDVNESINQSGTKNIDSSNVGDSNQNEMSSNSPEKAGGENVNQAGEEVDTDKYEMTTSNDANSVSQDGNNDNTKKMDSQNDDRTLTNLGSMGWRFCNYPIRKRQDDRYGRRGTRARILMRMANSLDALDERPTSWPKPPPGFTTRRVLGPGSDFKRRNYHSNKRGRNDNDRGGKRRKRNSAGSYENQYDDRDSRYE